MLQIKGDYEESQEYYSDEHESDEYANDGYSSDEYISNEYPSKEDVINEKELEQEIKKEEEHSFQNTDAPEFYPDNPPVNERKKKNESLNKENNDQVIGTSKIYIEKSFYKHLHILNICIFKGRG